jgi:hypothetical protein
MGLKAVSSCLGLPEELTYMMWNAVMGKVSTSALSVLPSVNDMTSYVGKLAGACTGAVSAAASLPAVF